MTGPEEVPVGVLEPHERPLDHWWIPFDGGRDFAHIRPDGQILVTPRLAGITVEQLRPLLPYNIPDHERL